MPADNSILFNKHIMTAVIHEGDVCDTSRRKRVICRQRYYKSGLQQRRQFIKEVKAHELLQIKALDGVRVHRIFCNTVLSPLEVGEIIKLTIKQEMKIVDILKTNLGL
ncbi:hypothetical protein NQ317_015697 [Molorchus minor]|uniref:Uncharacterized protein n=1 Tax=Molorchus minor TaxID=1323400 RepID=A0ABQ9J398_9CUCU|nr:hypothetical protein NQ317_015697 [Molorchus minor]